ncbi:MAG: hypothetical protein WA902_23045 [Thermosynechococcaceae cyanobacterium]
MKKLFTSAGVALLIAGAGAVLPNAAQAQSITPDSAAPKGNNYGLVQSIDSQALQVRGADGTTQVYPLDEGVTPPSNLGPGDLVVFDTNKQGVVKNIQPPVQSRVTSGTVDRIEGDQVTYVPDGGSAPVSTTVSPTTISRLGLTEGQSIQVTEYQGIGTTRVCSVPVAVVEPPPPEVAPPIPFTGGAEPPPPEPVQIAPGPIDALW